MKHMEHRVSNTSMIGISPRRADQIKAIATAKNMSIADAIGAMVRREIAEGTIPNAIPGVVIKKAANGIQITIDDGSAKTLRPEGAKHLAATIRNVIGGAPSVVSIDHGFSVLRRGNGVKLAIPFPGPEVSFSTDVAGDFADLIDEAAA